VLLDGDVQLDEIALRGPVRVEADLTGAQAARSGGFIVDATDAELDFGGSFHKPSGAPASVTGRVVSGPGGVLAIDDVKLRVRGRNRRARRRQTQRHAGLGWKGCARGGRPGSAPERAQPGSDLEGVRGSGGEIERSRPAAAGARSDASA
jgi:hypothetical protein